MHPNPSPSRIYNLRQSEQRSRTYTFLSPLSYQNFQVHHQSKPTGASFSTLTPSKSTVLGAQRTMTIPAASHTPDPLTMHEETTHSGERYVASSTTSTKSICVVVVAHISYLFYYHKSAGAGRKMAKRRQGLFHAIPSEGCRLEGLVIC